jgi:hypothetical protein
MLVKNINETKMIVTIENFILSVIKNSLLINSINFFIRKYYINIIKLKVNFKSKMTK